MMKWRKPGIALVTSLLLCLAIVSTGVFAQSAKRNVAQSKFSTLVHVVVLKAAAQGMPGAVRHVQRSCDWSGCNGGFWNNGCGDNCGFWGDECVDKQTDCHQTGNNRWDDGWFNNWWNNGWLNNWRNNGWLNNWLNNWFNNGQSDRSSK